MSKSKLLFSQISKIIEQGVYNYKDLSNEFISILKSKRDELIFKMKKLRLKKHKNSLDLVKNQKILDPYC